VPTDAAGTEHYPAGAKAGIVSLVPSLTELVFELGLEKQLLGRTSKCAEPQGRVDAITIVGSPTNIDLMKLAELGPSHVLVSINDTPETTLQEIINLGVQVVVTHCDGPEDVPALLDLMGGIFDREAQAEALTAALQREIEAIRLAAAQHPVRKVIYLTWKNPWLTISPDCYTARMLALAGLSLLSGDSTAASRELQLDQAFLSQAQLVLFGDDPFQFEEEDVQDFQLDHGIGSIPALEMIDSRGLSWPGKRAVDGLRELSEIIAQL